MSRRSRKRGAAGGAGWPGKAAIGLVLAGLVVAAVLYAMVRSYLHSDAFRQFLSAKAGEVAGVSGEFTPFRWDGLAVDTSEFDGTGGGIVKHLRVEGMHTEVGLRGVSRGVWEIQGSRIQRLEATVDARGDGGGPSFQGKALVSSSGNKARSKSWLPNEVELMGLEVRELSVKALLDQGPASVAGMNLSLEPAGKKNAYRAEIADGTIRLPFSLVPEIRLDHANLRYQDGQVFLSHAGASAWNSGLIDAAGEWDVSSGRYAVEGSVSSVKCDEVFNEDWSKRLTGDVESGFTLDNHGGPMVARGKLTIRNATLTALPVLDALAAYSDTRRFRTLSLSDAHTSWRWRNGELFLTDLVIGSEGLARLEGSITIRDSELDGLFRLGLAPGTLSSIPGAETLVFTPGERGLVWAPLRITGTLDDPKEDLTDRLIAAAGLRMFDVIPETGEKVIKFSRSLLGDAPEKVVDEGAKIISKGVEVVDDLGGVIDGFFGTGRRGQPKPEPEKTDP
jgi:hypothetical protein